MSILHKYTCDVCGKFWDGQVAPPEQLLGIEGEFASPSCKLVNPIGKTCKAHICKACVKSIAEQAVRLSTTNYDFEKLR